jgi:hypothetical protein
MWLISVIPALKRLKQVDYEFKASVVYLEISCPAWATIGRPHLTHKNK